MSRCYIGSDFFWEIPRPKKPFQLPRFFTQDDVAAILKSIHNEKHKTLLMLCYATGMRVSEVVHLKTVNVMSDRKCILIEQAKGKKDRVVAVESGIIGDVTGVCQAVFGSEEWVFISGVRKLILV